MFGFFVILNSKELFCPFSEVYVNFWLPCRSAVSDSFLMCVWIVVTFGQIYLEMVLLHLFHPQIWPIATHPQHDAAIIMHDSCYSNYKAHFDSYRHYSCHIAHSSTFTPGTKTPPEWDNGFWTELSTFVNSRCLEDVWNCLHDQLSLAETSWVSSRGTIQLTEL